MHEAALLPTGSTVVASSGTSAEVAVVVAVVVLFAALLLVKAKRGHDQKIRKAASVGYFDPDAARYGPGSVPPPAGDNAEDAAHLPLAPSFVAPGRGTGTHRADLSAPSPQAVPSSFGALITEPPRAVPAFDPVEAVRARPVSAGGSLPTTGNWPPPPPPVPTGFDDPSPPDGAPGDAPPPPPPHSRS